MLSGECFLLGLKQLVQGAVAASSFGKKKELRTAMAVPELSLVLVIFTFSTLDKVKAQSPSANALSSLSASNRLQLLPAVPTNRVR